MFPWNIAKSAEAMFSRWAIKRVCKFLLKKKLGKFILGEVDLNQLDVQLSAGTVQLSDLALNVDYLNQKLGATGTIIVKEGSIGSLMITLPWRGDGCGIEVNELELVLAPCKGNTCHDESETSPSGRVTNYSVNRDSGRIESDASSSGDRNSSIDVHEGVKTIANMVKWLLSSFHVRIKKLIVAFDPGRVEGMDNRFSRTLVLRIAEIECGTSISEDAHLIDEARDNIVGFSRLTNFVRFQGAVLEFLEFNGVREQTACARTPGTTFGECFSHCCKSTALTPIITGKDGGFSGNLKLSIPWENGSLDIRKVDAEANVDPLKLKFQPTTILCFMYLYNIFKDSPSSVDSQKLSKPTESVYDNATSIYHSTMQVASGSLTGDMLLSRNDKSTVGSSSSFLVEKHRPKALLSESDLISDWIGRSQKDKTCPEPDFGASVDQFFECLDELRSSQSAMGNSGMWNWTSYITALTAATNLASGTLTLPPVQQLIETNLKVNIADIALLVLFSDEEPVHPFPGWDSQASASHDIHYLEMKFQGVFLSLKVCPEVMNFETTVQQIELDDHFSSTNDISDARSQSNYIQIQQDAVEYALTPSPLSCGQAGEVNRRVHEKDDHTSNIVNVALIRTSGISRCQVTVSTGSCDDFVLGLTSFTLKLPPFILWANLALITKVLDLLKEIGSCNLNQGRNESLSSSAQVASISSTETLRGNIVLVNARIILMLGYSSFDQLIALDFTSPTVDHNGDQPPRTTSFGKEYSLQRSRSLQLSWGDLVAYLIDSDVHEHSGTGLFGMPRFFAQKLLSISDATGQYSTIGMFWQDSALTGPWISKKAKLLATAENLKSGDRFTGKDYECVSVTNVKDLEDFEDHARQDIIISSKFFLHAQLSPVLVNLGKIQYDGLLHFLLKLINSLPSLASESASEESCPSQGSILVECVSVEIAISMDEVASASSSIQRELPGSWCSFRLKVENFELLSVSNIGGVETASFLWAVHGEGNLWGSVTGVSHEELLLVSCSNSVRGRGDGQGSNLLAPRLSGSDIVHFSDPVDFHSYISIAVRCGTVVATGGRVDWWDSLSSFFTLPSHELEQEDDNNLKREGSERSTPSGTSFVLNLVDIGVCYEPYLTNGSGVYSPVPADKCAEEHYFACLLAASSLTLSNTNLPGSHVSEHILRMQNIGLLLCPVSGSKISGSTYDVKHLIKAGYVKVAQVAHLEALLRISCMEDQSWEVVSSGFDIGLSTCCDTTTGLIRLGGQLQQLFTPDLEDTLVHLESRWNNVQGANQDDENKTHSDDATLSDSEIHFGMQDTQCMGNLMDEICEDAFQLVENTDGHNDDNYMDRCMPVSNNILAQPADLGVRDSEDFAGCFPVGLGNGTSLQHGAVPELLEEYFLSDLRPLSELSINSDPSLHGLHSRTGIMGSKDVQKRESGWYGDSLLQIVEDHISEDGNQSDQQHIEDFESSSSCTGPDGYGKIAGRVLLKNMNVVWSMYGGCDWKDFQKTSKHCSSGRDTTTCLEVLLSGMQIQYDILPEGGTCVSVLSVNVQDFFLNDYSQSAPWKLVLGYYQSKDHPRKSSSKAFKMDLQSVRPDPLTPLEEYRLRVALLPIRLHLHQSQLDFLINFFGKPDDATCDTFQAGKESRNIVNVGQCTIIEEALLPYFQKFDVWPVLIRVDYRPSRVDLAALSGGKYVELVNVVPWTGIELQLKHVHSAGVYGLSAVCEGVLGEWLEDISQNQIHKLLKGLPPIRSLVAVGSGAKKMFTLPVKNYKKDRRLVKGVQRGTVAFLRSISIEAIGLGVHLAAGAHDILHQVEYMLGSIPPSVPSSPLESSGNKKVRSNQPKDALQGMKQACGSISGGMSRSASALVRTPLKRYQSDGIGSALVTAVQGAPIAVVAPASAAARAIHCAFLGLRNSLDPERKKESVDKYQGSTPRRDFM